MNHSWSTCPHFKSYKNHDLVQFLLPEPSALEKACQHLVYCEESEQFGYDEEPMALSFAEEKKQSCGSCWWVRGEHSSSGDGPSGKELGAGQLWGPSCCN